MAAARAFGRPPVRSSGAPLMMLRNAGRAGPLDSMEQRMRLPGRARSGGNGGALWRSHLRFSTGTSGLCVRIAADGRWIWSSPGPSGEGMKPGAWCPHRKSDRGRTSPFRGEGLERARDRKFADSPLEGDGFEPSVPRLRSLAAFVKPRSPPRPFRAGAWVAPARPQIHRGQSPLCLLGQRSRSLGRIGIGRAKIADESGIP
jgi:hypothetical protein